MIGRGQLDRTANMNKVEVAINLSHYKIWKKVARSKRYDMALVFEDDVSVKSTFVDDLNRILATLRDHDITFSILHLHNGNWNHTLESQRHRLTIPGRSPHVIMQETLPYNASASAYVISKSYARWLCDHMFPIVVPQDILMGKYPTQGNHLTIKMRETRSRCYKSPILSVPCGGPGGTGQMTTQTYGAPTVRQLWRKVIQRVSQSRKRR